MTVIILMYAIWACSTPISKYLLGYSTPMFLAGSRFFIGGLALIAYQYFYLNQQIFFKKKHWWILVQMGFFGICATYILRLWALKDLSATKTCFLYNLSPFMSSFFSYLLFKERMTQRQWMGLLIGFIGLTPILLSTNAAEQQMGEIFYLSWQELAVLCSIITYSYGWILMRKLVKFKKYSPLMVNSIVMLGSGSALLIGSLTYEVWYQGAQPVSHLSTFFSWLAISIIVSNFICRNLYGYLLKKYTATLIAFAGFIGPLFTALYGWAFLNESITWHFYVSAIIVFFGLLLFHKDELSQKQVKALVEQ